MAPLRFGILSTANIGNVFRAAVEPVDDVVVFAVASRDVDKARQYAEQYGIQRACTYDELVEDPDVDAIYVPLPTALATGWAVRAAQNRKHGKYNAVVRHTNRPNPYEVAPKNSKNKARYRGDRLITPTHMHAHER